MARRKNKRFKRRIRQAIPVFLLAFGASRFASGDQTWAERNFHITIMEDLGINWRFNRQATARYFREFEAALDPHLLPVRQSYGMGNTYSVTRHWPVQTLVFNQTTEFMNHEEKLADGAGSTPQGP